MATAPWTKHLGTALGFAALAFVVVGPTVAVPLSRRLAARETDQSALRSLRLVEAALERGERADALADRIGAVTGFHLLVVGRDGRRLGDSGAKEAGLPEPLEPELAALVEEVRARGLVQTRIVHRGSTYAASGMERGRGNVLLALRPSPGGSASLRPSAQAALMGALAFAALGLVYAAFLARMLRPAREIGEVARALVRGNLAARTRSDRDDELGDLGRAVDGVADELLSRIEELSVEKARIGTVLDTMVEAVFVTDARGRIVLTNAATEKLVEGEALDRTPMEAVRSVELHRAVQEAHGGGVRQVEFEIRIGEELRTFAATVARMRRGEGVVVVLHDVTRLKDVDRIRRDFVANASHELRTPLTAIRGYAETLRDGGHRDEAMAARFLDVILRHTIRLQRLVDDLVSLSRAESPDSPLEVESVDVVPVVEDVVRGLESTAAARGIRIELTVEHPLPTARTNATALDQIALNLVDNAIKYGPAEAPIRIRLAVRDGAIALEVWNGGQGIPPQHLDRLFERFYRVDPGRSRDIGGTGLGLSIVKHLAQRVGADIGVESGASRGTTFRLTLPIA